MSRYDELMGFSFPEVVQHYGTRDTILYALGVGAGEPPGDPWELRHVYEPGLRALPTMAVTLAYPGNWYRDLSPGLDFVRTVHASERFEIHNTLPVAASVVARARIIAIHDKGEGRGALVVSERLISDRQSGTALATVTQTAFCRGDGGLGGPVLPVPAPHPIPGREPEHTVVIPTSRRSALIYRLSGDDNPLHADPEFAAQAGFAAPILHGLSTYGHIGRTILAAFCRDDGCSIRIMDCRFTSVVFPGDSLELALWREKDVVSFRAVVNGRTVVDNGMAVLT